jgi:hypothetical protein
VPLEEFEEPTETTVEGGTQGWDQPEELRDIFAHMDEIDPPKKKNPPRR